MREGRIVKVSGPLVVAEGLPNVRMYDVVRVGKHKLVGEVIELRGGKISIQVYEETGGIGPGEPVISTDSPLSVELGPGLISSIYDGIQRPLDLIKDKTGDYISRGINVPGLSHDKKWRFESKKKSGDKVRTGDIIGVVKETSLVEHRIMVPPGIEGEIISIEDGEFTIDETIAVIKMNNGKGKIPVTMKQKWPVRMGRPYDKKFPTNQLLITGTRVIDTFYPITKGGTACIPGPFGSGKTVVLHQLAKWADADIIIYVGCGERGNEMTDVLLEFPQLKDPSSGEPLMKRTVLVANTSNMPVAAREASVYTGVTIGEYFRDMGYKVALMADSTSRWAEALREISGRLEEMPGEEGYPAYLGTRIAEFYERAGRVKCLGNDNREGSLSIIGAVSPPGGDLSDPVVVVTLRMVKVFWSLEDKLAFQRHFPAISWLRSYSLYLDNVKEYLGNNVAQDYLELRKTAMRILQDEASLEEIVRLVGVEALSPKDRLILSSAKSLREDFLHQHAFDPQDQYTTLSKQYNMIKAIISFHDRAIEHLSKGADILKILEFTVRSKIARMKFIPEENQKEFSQIFSDLEKEFKSLDTEVRK